MYYSIVILCLLSGITFADTLDVRKFTPIKLPATIPDENRITDGNRFSLEQGLLDTNWVKNVLSESEDVGRQPDYPYYHYFAESRFTVYDSILAIVVRKSGPAGGLEEYFYLYTFDQNGNRIAKCFIAGAWSEGGAGSDSFARIDKKGNIKIRTDDWKGLSNITTKKGKWKFAASITPTGNIEQK